MPSPVLPAHLYYGGDYNPEQWPEEVWKEDVQLMRQAGVNLVSVAIFSWAKIQPKEGVFEFEWLDRVLALLAEQQIGVCLATATASPPPWLSRQYPDTLPVDVNGTTLFPGSRQHYSPSSRTYRRLAAELVRAIGTRYARHPALVAWHINNEYACHLTECHSAASTAAFREWLRARYGDIAELNRAWGTTFWSQVYQDWDEIFTPRKAPYHSNPTQWLDFRRFTSDAFLECYRAEASILRELSPTIPITTNFMGFHRPLDYHRWAGELDFAAWDSYPDPLDEREGRHWSAIGHDLTRSLKPDRPWVLMEQAPSAVNWRPVNRPKRPGLMRLQSLQAVARGADGVMFFQWRASRAGAEKFHSALVPHIPHQQSRVFAEVEALGSDLGRLRAVAGSLPPPPEVAIVFDWNNWWACDLESKPGKTDCVAWVRRLHQWLYEHNLAVNFVSPGANLDSYKLVIAPMLYLLRRDDAEQLDAYVQRGGQLLVTYFSGIVDEDEQVVLGGYPGWLRQTLGIWVEEWCPYPAGQTNGFRFSDSSEEFGCKSWCDLLHLETATTLAEFTEDFFAGRPAFTHNPRGNGSAYYLATEPDESGLHAIFEYVIRAAKLRPPLVVPIGVEVTRRTSPKGEYLFVLNHTSEAVAIPLGQPGGTDLLSGQRVDEMLKLDPLGVAVIAH